MTKTTDSAHNWHSSAALLLRCFLILLAIEVSTSETGLFKEKAWEKYCRKENFIKDYVEKDLIPQKNLTDNMNRTCWTQWGSKQNCKSDNMYPFLTFRNTTESYIIGTVHARPKEETVYDCWAYYVQAYSHRQQKVVFHKFFTDKSPGYEEGTISFIRPFPTEDYGEEFTLTLTAFPDGESVDITSRVLPNNYCQKIARYEAMKVFWEQFSKRNDCDRHFGEGNLQRVAEQFCTHYKNTNDAGFIKRKAQQEFSVKYCFVTFNAVITDAAITNVTRYIWLAGSIALVLIISFGSYKCVMRRKKKGLAVSTNLTEKMLPSESNSTVSLPLDTVISVMILHRPGCEQLDNFIRDLSYVIHLYGINVASPLLEMSQIDAEGGIAAFMQRNIDACTYVVVVVTETTNTETVYRNHKPFEFSMKMLSGLAFRDNDCSRYIPVYIRDYKDILTYIPAFLIASRNCGYRIPDNIAELVKFMKKTDSVEQSKELETTLNFFLEKLKLDVRNILRQNHKNCCQGACAQGTIPDDISELWAGTNSVTTAKRSNRDNIEHYQSLISTSLDRSEAMNIHKLDLILDHQFSNAKMNCITNKTNTIERWRMSSIKNSELLNYDRDMVASMPFLYQSSI